MKGKLFRVFLIFSAIVIFGILFYSLYESTKFKTSQVKEFNKRAISFKLPRLDELNDSISLESMRDKIIILNFWASWCEPCKYEVNELNKIYEMYGNKISLIGINIWDKRENALEFVKNYNIKFLNLYARGSTITIDYGITGVPETIIIDKNGIIKYHFKGAINFELIKEILDQF